MSKTKMIKQSEIHKNKQEKACEEQMLLWVRSKNVSRTIYALQQMFTK